MSLRLRLLLAVGPIAIIALVVADFATYSALRTSLYNQVDQQLAQQRTHLVGTPTGVVLSGCVPHDLGAPGGTDADAGNSGNSGNRAPRRAEVAIPPESGSPTSLPSVTSRGDRSRSTVVNSVECPAYVDDHPLSSPVARAHHRLQPQPDGSQAAYFTTGSIASGGPAFGCAPRS